MRLLRFAPKSITAILRSPLQSTLRVALVVVLVAMLPSVAEAENRFALLIGNQNYKSNVGPLKNPHNDVALVGNALEHLLFKLTGIRDAGYRAIETALRVHIQTVRRS